MDVDLDYDGDPTPEQIMDIDAEEVRPSQRLDSGATNREKESGNTQTTENTQHATMADRGLDLTYHSGPRG